MEELLEQNRQLITKEIDLLAKEIKKIDEKIIKESEPFRNGNISPKSLEKFTSFRIEREKLLHTQTAFYTILGHWKSK